jgi:hypothetical protein
MFCYDNAGMKSLLWDIIVKNIPVETQDWLQKMGDTQPGTANFNTAFILIPRKTGKALIKIDKAEKEKISAIRPGFSIDGWTIDRLSRVWLLLGLDNADKDKYFRTIENLFLAAEMNELVALYSALPLLAYPEIWIKRCAEGIRSNIAGVLEAIMCNNPYPAGNLEQAAWNQLVIKAFFTEKPVQLITGLDTRANKELAYTLADYARERWAAGRKVNPMLWRLVGKFIDERIFNDILIGLTNDDALEKNAIALAVSESSYQPAKKLFNGQADGVTWDSFIV